MWRSGRTFVYLRIKLKVMIKFTFESEKSTNPNLSHLTEGSYNYFSDSPRKELVAKYLEYKNITEEKDKQRRSGKSKTKACTGYFGFLWEDLINNKPGKGGDRNPDRDDSHIMGSGDNKAYVVNIRKNKTFGFKEKPTITQIDFNKGEEVVKNKLSKGLHIGLFVHHPKSVFKRMFLTTFHWTPSNEELNQMLFEAKCYQNIAKEKGYEVFNTHSNFLYEQGIYPKKGIQLIHLKQGGNGKAKMKEDGSYHMNFALSNSVGNKLILQDKELELKLKNIYENTSNSNLRS